MRLISVSSAIFLLFGGVFNSYAQSYSVTGLVTDAEGSGLVGVTVTINETNQGAISKLDGTYQISNVPKGKYTISLSSIGYKNISQEINITNKSLQIPRVVMSEDASELEELVVYGKSEATLVREQAYAVEVIEAKGFKNLSTNANDILGTISGVNIRQTGGIGSSFSLSINGLSDSQVRIFMDGVPMDYFGTSLSLNNFSANLIDRVEIYKGVVPVHLSSDALGGAVNIITNSKTDSYLDASYSLGSYNSHIASLNTQYRSKKNGFSVRLKSFYNSSDNNYEIPVKLTNTATLSVDDFDTYVERFHDAYSSSMVWLESGFINTKFADQLMVGVLYSENYDEVQQPENEIDETALPYGEVTTEEEKVIVNLSYKKNDLLDDKLGINAFMVAVDATNISKDISDYDYQWDGHKQINDATTGEAESRKTLLMLDTKSYLGNFNAEYKLFTNHSFAVNYIFNHFDLQGEDDYRRENATQFANPNTLTKQVLGANYTQNFFDSKLKNTFFVKYYTYRVNSVVTDYLGLKENFIEESENYQGVGLSSTYQLNKFQVKASFENAIRFPEVVEIFGNGNGVRANPLLEKERSNNYNLGLIFNNSSPRNNVILSLNGFIREVDNLVYPVLYGVWIQYENKQKALAKGLDLSASYNMNNKFVFNFNGTYVDKRGNNKWLDEQQTNPDNTFDIRFPNEPYLFGNLSTSYRKENLFMLNDNFSATLTESYVHDFYLKWAHIASDKADVPYQLTTNLALVYSMSEGRYNVSFGINNLFDSEVFDNYNQKRPGRTYNVKLRYFFNQ